ncbi:T6SS effector amidase Tae4 family protein [uncultured Acinetobacter sp.]|uniref:T6SS effector amidase Tae4 family protein n=1 Tax=uncultured Acinetobacter sp. TaxID=165433 RepID=UPI00258D8E77|nr:T6SS effector amidase Tae4 family protein [uncultured Acinetobacter sp.]
MEISQQFKLRNHRLKQDSGKNNQDVSSQLVNKKGIIIFKVSGWGDASGHVTLWNGNDCGDSCYFTHNQPNVITTEILFWNLK